MTVIAVTNAKGGVAKTSTVLGLADEAAHRGLKVLVLDLDSQANTTDALVDQVDPAWLSMNDVMAAGAVGCAADAIRRSSWGLDFVPTTVALAHRASELVPGGEHTLRRALTGIAGLYDLVLVDCPPALGRLSINALVAADLIVIPTEPSAASTKGTAETLRTVALIKETSTPHLAVGAVVMSMFDATRESALRWDELVADPQIGPLLFPVPFKKRVVVRAAYGCGVPVRDFLPDPAAKEIVAVFDGLLTHLLGTNHAG